MINPLFNADQFSAEDDVIAMWQTNTVVQARATAGRLFDLAYGADTPKEARPTFDAAMDEYVTNYLFKAAASNPARPRFVRDFMPAYRWRGVDVPGARMGGDNPDNVYRLAGIAHGGNYRVSVTPTGREPANTSFTITGNFGTSVTIQTIEAGNAHRQEDGSFEITIDGEPANGRPNHLTTAKHAKFIYVRESIDDWGAERPYDLKIERLDTADDALTIAEMAEIASFRLIEDVPLYYWFQRLFSGLRQNTLRPPTMSGAMGGLVSQAGAQGYFSIGDDECVMIKYKPASAAYASVQLVDWWFRSIDAHLKISSRTQHQSILDADGWVRLVAAKKDPGVANWLDTGGLNTFLLIVRWQGLPADRNGDDPVCETQVVKQNQLGDFMPDNHAVDSEFRKAELEKRIADWRRRVQEN